MKKCTLALGCFWKPEENFKNKLGIIETEVGYAVGKNPNVTYEDSCVNCCMPYCYDYISHDTSYDTDESSCNGATEMWVVPGPNSNDPYFDNYCNDSCPDGFMPDDCGHCWKSFCYTFFQEGLNGDPVHTVYYDLTQEECESYGFGYYLPDNPSNPYWNSSCDAD